MTRKILLSLVLVVSVLATSAGAAVFTVTPTSGNDCSNLSCDLQSALNAAASNGQDDTINIAAGTYTFSSPLTYTPTASSGENFALTIVGAGNDKTILNMGTMPRFLNIDTSALTNASNTSITLNDFTIAGDGNIYIKGGKDLQLGATLSSGSGWVSLSTGGGITFASIISTGNLSISPQTASETVGTVINVGTAALSNISLTASGTLSVNGSNISNQAGTVVVTGMSLNATGSLSSGNLSVSEATGIRVISPNFSVTSPLLPVMSSVMGTANTIAINAGASIQTDAVAFKSITNLDMGMSTNNGTVTSVTPVDPATANNINKPTNMVYGLVDMQIKVNKPGDTAVVTFYLPSPAPAGYKWYKYNALRGWYDYSDHAVFSADRSQVTLTLTDGGIGDDDGVADGVIKDPVGLGTGDAPPATASSGGGCFIATAAYGSPLDRHVTILRTFRDRCLLTNVAGRKFVELYYRFSPPAADYIAHHQLLRSIVRVCLLPAIAFSWIALQFGSNPLWLIVFLPLALVFCGRIFNKIKRVVLLLGNQQ